MSTVIITQRLAKVREAQDLKIQVDMAWKKAIAIKANI